MRKRSAGWVLACVATVAVAAACQREPGDRDRVPSVEATPPAAGAEGAAQDIQDAWITTKVQAAYFTDADVKGRNIDVTTDQGVVTLTGVVEDEKARQQAVSIAQNVDGVVRVDDRLTARMAEAERAPAAPVEEAGEPEETAAPAAGALSNAWITTKIEAKYFADDEVKGRRIDVTTNNGVVTLAGQVQSQTEKEAALRIARETEGVRRVEDQLRVVAMTAETGGPAAGAPGAPAPAPVAGEPGRVAGDVAGAQAPGVPDTTSDEAVTTRVQSKLFLDDTVKERDIEVAVRDGVVTLSGDVANETEKHQAVSVARSVAGVARVDDQLRVSPGVRQEAERAAGRPEPGRAPGTDDEWIVTKVQSEYFLDEEVKQGDVEVSSSSGVVTLSGDVPSPAAKQRAENIARQVTGVSEVENELSVNPRRESRESPTEHVEPVPPPAADEAPGQPIPPQ